MVASLHMVDGEGLCSESSLNSFMADAGLIRAGTDYNVVSILGCQSSGKSTLLNMLFGTGFEVMDSDSGRSQTTKGVWIARANTEDVANLVMDVEGTDSKERGEENQSFERKTSLLSLALAEVLVVNIWEHDIGRYNASNYALLKTVMEVNLQLFARKDTAKTYMLFVVRDHAQTPIERLEDMVNKDIGEIWSSLSKPDHFEDSKVSDFFDIGFFPLPHFVHQPDKFKEQVGELKKKFNDKSHEGYLFKPEYSKAVPADGFPHYASEIWSVIQENKDLDLPTQREMVALYRCDEIMNECFTEFSEGLKGIKVRDNANQLNDGVGSALDTLFETAFSSYGELAAHYSPNVSEKKKEELAQKMRDASHTLFEQYLLSSRQSLYLRFKENLIVGLTTGDGKASRNFASLVDGLLSDTVAALPAAAQGAVPGNHVTLVADVDESEGGDGTQWSYGQALAELRAACKQEVAHMRTQEMSKFEKECDANQDILLRKTQEVLDLGRKSMWADMAKTYESIDSSAKRFVTEGLAGFEPSDDVESAFVATVRRKLRAGVVKQCRAACSDIQVRMRKKFDAVFRFDEAGVPRAWLPSDNIREHFVAGVTAAQQILDRYANMDLGDGNEEAILSESQCEETMRLFKADVESAFVEAQRMQEYQKNKTNVPWFFWLMLVFFGFNEVTAVLFNPLLLITVILALGGALYGYLLLTSSSSPTAAMIMPALHQLGIGPYVEPLINMAMDVLGLNPAAPASVGPNAADKDDTNDDVSPSTATSASKGKGKEKEGGVKRRAKKDD